MKTLFVIAALLVVSQVFSQTVNNDMIVKDPVTGQSAVVSPSRIYLLNPSGQVFAIMTVSVTGAPRGIISVLNPATGHYITLDPDYGISSSGVEVGCHGR